MNNKKNFPITHKNVLLRGSILKNSEFAIGIVCYVGKGTKVMQNSINAREKKSLLEN